MKISTNNNASIEAENNRQVLLLDLGDSQRISLTERFQNYHERLTRVIAVITERERNYFISGFYTIQISSLINEIFVFHNLRFYYNVKKGVWYRGTRYKTEDRGKSDSEEGKKISWTEK